MYNIYSQEYYQQKLCFTTLSDLKSFFLNLMHCRPSDYISHENKNVIKQFFFSYHPILRQLKTYRFLYRKKKEIKK
jgi:hypothetical protein